MLRAIPLSLSLSVCERVLELTAKSEARAAFNNKPRRGAGGRKFQTKQTVVVVC